MYLEQATPFQPLGWEQLTEASSIALAEQIRQIGISTPLSDAAIATTYVQQGQGNPPILLLHGFDSSLLEFRRLLPLLAAKTQTWAVDLLGFGFTDRPLGLNFSPLAIKTHLYAFWKTLIAQPVILVGASMGGAAAIDFTLTYPEVVQKLVLLDSAGYSGGAIPGKLLFPPLDRLATAFLRNPGVRRKVTFNAYHNPSFASVDAQNCASLHLTHPSWSQALITFTKSGGYGCFRPQLSQITQPTLILWGECDRILGTADAEGFKQAIPQSQLVWVPQCGHVPHLEQSQFTAQQILTFADL